jgi:hypothetical protein
MGLFTGLLTLPLAPVRGVMWVGNVIAQEAYRQWTDPELIRTELQRTHERWLAGEITDAQRDELEDGLLQRLMAGRQNGDHG